ncbi:MAG TPA: lasso peptide biosynthesis B2 protein [Pseudonocardiaceae bacterium]|nr:lasso peptide biosynthesis B2 protein [Pseudonocardiaceae bacterium]
MKAGGRVRLAWEALRALWPLALVEVGLRTSDLTATCRRLRVRCDLASPALPATEPTPPAELAVLPAGTVATVRACRAVLARWPGGNTCLRQCLLIGHRLRGLDPVLRIGVRRDRDGSFSAHSWLEIRGRALDPTASEYAALGRTEGMR